VRGRGFLTGSSLSAPAANNDVAIGFRRSRNLGSGKAATQPAHRAIPATPIRWQASTVLYLANRRLVLTREALSATRLPAFFPVSRHWLHAYWCETDQNKALVRNPPIGRALLICEFGEEQPCEARNSCSGS
jgi:hypothetical protein